MLVLDFWGIDIENKSVYCLRQYNKESKNYTDYLFCENPLSLLYSALITDEETIIISDVVKFLIEESFGYWRYCFDGGFGWYMNFGNSTLDEALNLLANRNNELMDR